MLIYDNRLAVIPFKTTTTIPVLDEEEQTEDALFLEENGNRFPNLTTKFKRDQR
jgi:hypothetical protein